MKKVPATFEFEKILWKQNIKYVVGMDEVGRGAWAGPLVAGAVIFPVNFNTEHNFFDSKMLSPTEREKSDEVIKQVSLASSVGIVEVHEIEQMGLSKANQVAFHRAISNLSVKAEHVLVDAFFFKIFSKNQANTNSTWRSAFSQYFSGFYSRKSFPRQTNERSGFSLP